MPVRREPTSPLRFSLATAGLAVTVFCAWLSAYQYSVELFTGIGLTGIALAWGWWRMLQPARPHIVLYELLVIAICLSAGLGLIINQLVDS